MKKIFIVVVIGIVLLSGVSYAEISNTLDTTWAEKKQRESAFEATAILENTTRTVNEALARLQTIKDSGQFDTLPIDLKQALNKWWQIFKDIKTDIQSDIEIMEIYQWSPK